MIERVKRKIARVSGSIWNDNTRTVAQVVNNNADVMFELCDEINRLQKAVDRLSAQLEKEHTNL